MVNEQQQKSSMLSHEFIEYNIDSLRNKGIITDSLPIRAGCFNGEYMAIGTNSKCLKICNISNVISQIQQEELNENLRGANTSIMRANTSSLLQDFERTTKSCFHNKSNLFEKGTALSFEK
jgi:hypothetical protein